MVPFLEGKARIGCIAHDRCNYSFCRHTCAGAGAQFSGSLAKPVIVVVVVVFVVGDFQAEIIICLCK